MMIRVRDVDGCRVGTEYTKDKFATVNFSSDKKILHNVLYIRYWRFANGDAVAAGFGRFRSVLVVIH